MVPIQFYEPDATTFRSEYYYNARENVLYQRVATLAEGCSVNSGWVWKRITERR